MKFVEVNNDYVLVSDKTNGAEIKKCYASQFKPAWHDRRLQLLGHDANGSSRVISDDNNPWQHFFTLIEANDYA